MLTNVMVDSNVALVLSFLYHSCIYILNPFMYLIKIFFDTIHVIIRGIYVF